jgi:hypothetical protein
MSYQSQSYEDCLECSHYVSSYGCLSKCNPRLCQFLNNKTDKENKTDWEDKIKLDRGDLISMAKGICPNPLIMDDYPINKLGSYFDNQGWQWNWDAFNDLTDIDIYNIYIMCKNSWK